MKDKQAFCCVARGLFGSPPTEPNYHRRRAVGAGLPEILSGPAPAALSGRKGPWIALRLAYGRSEWALPMEGGRRPGAGRPPLRALDPLAKERIAAAAFYPERPIRLFRAPQTVD